MTTEELLAAIDAACSALSWGNITIGDATAQIGSYTDDLRYLLSLKP